MDFSEILEKYSRCGVSSYDRLKQHAKVSTKSDQCTFCKHRGLKNPFRLVMNDTLFKKFAASQNYYYCKDINDILGNKLTSASLMFEDIQCLVEEEEFLKRFYFKSEYVNKLTMLSEYYKYHSDIPRIFLQPSVNSLNNFHDKKRKLKY
jgi:hypothetical protein